MRCVLALAVVSLCSVPAFGEPRLTKELGDKVQAGKGKLTEKDVLKLVPGPVTITRPRAGRFGKVDADLILTWEEATKFEVVLVGGKVSSISATFSDVVKSKTLTLEKVKQLKEGMTQGEVEKVLGRPNGMSELVDDMGSTITRCVWSRHRQIVAYVKAGKVNGGGFFDTTDP